MLDQLELNDQSATGASNNDGQGQNKGKRIADIDVGSLEWIIHESGMAQEIKDYADKVLGEKYLEAEEGTKTAAEPKEDGDLSNNEEIQF